MSSERVIPLLLSIAWLLPLLGFVIEIFGGYWQKSRTSKLAAYLAIGCIAAGFVLSTAAFIVWGLDTDWAVFAATESGHHGADAGHGDGDHGDGDHGAAVHGAGGGQSTPGATIAGTFYRLVHFGPLDISIGYYIDSLTLLMFMMVTFIATCIHVFAVGYMGDELTDDHVDHHAHVSGGGHLHRPGRFYRFFAFMSLFCFSMLGLVLAGNIFQVFVFWELVGICSYFLIGFYVERKSASTAANKAFIVNRVGDFGFLIGLMIIWTYFGTFQFSTQDVGGHEKPGLFQMVRGDDGQLNISADGTMVNFQGVHGQPEEAAHTASSGGIPYWLLVAAGLGVFAGCVGKSAQFPLQTWLPDAMEGPTPVSALVHSATMVAAGVYLAGRFYPMFTPEVLMTIAYVGCVTLFIGATIAVVATDIKRVLAYSTISQLGYMMLGLGVGGWGPGLSHLVTHAFFKSLMFLCSGSVIIACHHEQEMTRMGGLRKKMPWTAYTMLVGVVAICGLAIVGTPIAFSGYHSKDAILATSLAFSRLNPEHTLLFVIPLLTAGLTAFYMFRLWFYTFAGEPRDKHLYDHAHESPWVMVAPLVALSVFAAFSAIGGADGPLFKMLAFSEPANAVNRITSTAFVPIIVPGHEEAHAVHEEAGGMALALAFFGTVVAYLLYGVGLLNPADIKRQFSRLHTFLVQKWWFDELYDTVFIKPAHRIAAWCAAFDRYVLDGFLHGCAKVTIDVSRLDRQFDEAVIDGLVNRLAEVTYSTGRSLRAIQTGSLRQYIMFLAVGVLSLVLLLLVFFPK